MDVSRTEIVVLLSGNVPLDGVEKLVIISATDLCVPVTSANKPIAMRITLRITTMPQRPQLFGYNTQISINDGKAIPSTDKHNAPNNEMNNANRGTEIANKTIQKKERIKVIRNGILTGILYHN